MLNNRLKFDYLINYIQSVGEARRGRRDGSRRGVRDESGQDPAVASEAKGEPTIEAAEITKRIGSTALAFRGYDVSNLGRSPELLDHRVYGPVVEGVLSEASEVYFEVSGTKLDLAERVRARAETTLATFAADIATIIAMEVAQVRLLEEFFEVPAHQARMSFGYSLGELAALSLGGVFPMREILAVPLAMAHDCAELAADTSMGILFTRGPALPMEDVERLCMAVSSQGHGLIGPSAYLSPNTALLLGQGDTLNRLEMAMGGFFPEKVSLRRNPNHWPPLHTPLVWQRNIPNRVAMALYHLEGGLRKPSPSVLSCVTGEEDYDELNCRDLLIRWTDHPQRLWDVVSKSLAEGISLFIHVGPEPKLIRATFERLSNNVCKQMGSRALSLLGNNIVPGLRQHAWLARLLPSQSALLRAPFVGHVILEDWLLEQPVS
jgi:[acyl-carrier-protein] S-malonyltransferase